MATLKVTTTRDIIVPNGTKEIYNGTFDWVSFAYGKKDAIHYYTCRIEDLPIELISGDFTVINDCELKAMQRLLKKKPVGIS